MIQKSQIDNDAFEEKMAQIFGDFVEETAQSEYLIIHFSPSVIPIQQRWQNNGLSADFLAEYWSTFFGEYDSLSVERQRELKGAINFIANELLENTIKFNYSPANHPIKLGLYLFPDRFRFYASNAISPQSAGPFQIFIQKLLTNDPQTLYFEQLLRAADEGNGSNSGLGLLTMLNDYAVRLAWKFETLAENADLVVVTAMVQLDLRPQF